MVHLVSAAHYTIRLFIFYSATVRDSTKFVIVCLRSKTILIQIEVSSDGIFLSLKNLHWLKVKPSEKYFYQTLNEL